MFTLLFTAEYIMRLSVVKRPLRYVFSFYGIIDFSRSCRPGRRSSCPNWLPDRRAPAAAAACPDL
jgi:hypothetical protein